MLDKCNTAKDTTSQYSQVSISISSSFIQSLDGAPLSPSYNEPFLNIAPPTERQCLINVYNDLNIFTQ